MSLYPRVVKNINFANRTFNIQLLGKLASEVHEKFSIYSFRVDGLGEDSPQMEAHIGLLTVAKLNCLVDGTYQVIERITYPDEESKWDSDFDDNEQM